MNRMEAGIAETQLKQNRPKIAQSVLAKITPNNRGEGNPTNDDQEQLEHTSYEWFLGHRPRMKQSDIIHSILNKRCPQLLAKQQLTNGSGFELPSKSLGLGLHRDCTGAALYGGCGEIVLALSLWSCIGTVLWPYWGCTRTALGLCVGCTGIKLGQCKD